MILSSGVRREKKIDIRPLSEKEGIMKLKTHGWILVCALALTLAGCPAQKEAEPPTPTVADQAVKAPETVAPGAPAGLEVPGLGVNTVWVGPGIDRTWKGLISLGERVRKDLDALEAYFATGKQFAAMDKLLAMRHAVVAGRNYEMMCCGGTAGFWEDVYSTGGTLNLKVVSVYASLAPGPHAILPASPEDVAKKLIPGKKTYDAVAFVAVEIHVISKGGSGAALHNDTYFMDLAYRHQWCCAWGDEELCPPPISGAI